MDRVHNHRILRAASSSASSRRRRPYAHTLKTTPFRPRPRPARPPTPRKTRARRATHTKIPNLRHAVLADFFNFLGTYGRGLRYAAGLHGGPGHAHGTWTASPQGRRVPVAARRRARRGGREIIGTWKRTRESQKRNINGTQKQTNKRPTSRTHARSRGGGGERVSEHTAKGAEGKHGDSRMQTAKGLLT